MRKPKVRRKVGMCWSCNGLLPVRKCKLWLIGQVKPLCAKCERTACPGSWPVAQGVSP